MWKFLCNKEKREQEDGGTDEKRTNRCSKQIYKSHMKKVEELITTSLKELLELRCITNINGATKSKLVYPLKQDGTRRISKQEGKLIFIKQIDQDGEYYYSVKAPTRKKYVSTGSVAMLENIDVCLYEEGKRKHLVKFLAFNPRQITYTKDFETLFTDEDGLDNYFIHLLQKANKGTLMNVENKYTEAIERVREKYNGFHSRLKIFLCEIDEKRISKYEVDENGELSAPEEVYKSEE